MIRHATALSLLATQALGQSAQDTLAADIAAASFDLFAPARDTTGSLGPLDGDQYNQITVTDCTLRASLTLDTPAHPALDIGWLTAPLTPTVEIAAVPDYWPSLGTDTIRSIPPWAP